MVTAESVNNMHRDILNLIGGNDAKLRLDGLQVETAMEGLEFFVSAFNIDTLKTPSLNDGNAMPASVCMMHFRLRVAAAKLVHVAVALHKEIAVNADAYEWLAGGKAKKPESQAFVVKPTVLFMLAAVTEHLDHFRTLLASDSFKKGGAAELTGTLSLIVLRNWDGVAGKYIQALKLYFVEGFCKCVGAPTSMLREACPLWRTWATEDTYEQKELEIFYNTFDNKIRSLIICVHSGLVQLVELCKVIHFPSAMTHPSVSSLVSGAKAAVKSGKDAVGLRACAHLLLQAGQVDARAKAGVQKSLEKLGSSLPA